MTQTKKLGASGITLKKGDTLYTNVKSVSRSGMSRQIAVYAIQDNKPFFISYYIAELLNYKMNNNNGAIKISGCGMDMAFAIVYELSKKLFNDGYALKQRSI